MKALLIIDMQKDFMPNGPLGVPGADALVPLINRLIDHFPLKIATKDWHPPNHVSFVTNHPGKKVGEVVQLKGSTQILWPVHCIQNTPGADFAIGLNSKEIDAVFYKGTDPFVDSYSAFFDNEKGSSTGLFDDLKGKKVTNLYICGVALEYCVLYSALDALKLGFHVHLLLDGCFAIDACKGDKERAISKMKEMGAKIIQTKEILWTN